MYNSNHTKQTMFQRLQIDIRECRDILDSTSVFKTNDRIDLRNRELAVKRLCFLRGRLKVWLDEIEKETDYE